VRHEGRPEEDSPDKDDEEDDEDDNNDVEGMGARLDRLLLELTFCRCRREPPRSRKEKSKEAAKRKRHTVTPVATRLLPLLRAGPTCPTFAQDLWAWPSS